MMSTYARSVPAESLRAHGPHPRVRGHRQVPVPRRHDARHDPSVPGAGSDCGRCLRGARADDWITSTFRGHGHALAKGLSPQEMLDELFGAETGCCKGRGGSMHVGNMDKGMVPGIAIVAGGIPLATGMALSFQDARTSRMSWRVSSAMARSPKARSTKASTWPRSGTCRSSSCARTISTAPRRTSTR